MNSELEKAIVAANKNGLPEGDLTEFLRDFFYNKRAPEFLEYWFEKPEEVGEHVFKWKIEAGEGALIFDNEIDDWDYADGDLAKVTLGADGKAKMPEEFADVWDHYL